VEDIQPFDADRFISKLLGRGDQSTSGEKERKALEAFSFALASGSDCQSGGSSVS
jgi:signal recognition particle GTPase